MAQVDVEKKLYDSIGQRFTSQTNNILNSLQYVKWIGYVAFNFLMFSISLPNTYNNMYYIFGMVGCILFFLLPNAVEDFYFKLLATQVAQQCQKTNKFVLKASADAENLSNTSDSLRNILQEVSGNQKIIILLNKVSL